MFHFTTVILLLAVPLSTAEPAANQSSVHCDKLSIFKWLSGDYTWPTYLKYDPPGFHHIDEGKHLLTMTLPHYLPFSTHTKMAQDPNVQACLGSLDEDDKFEMVAQLDGPGGQNEQIEFSCPYKELLKEAIDSEIHAMHQCYKKGTNERLGRWGRFLTFNLTECGRFNFTISGKASSHDMHFYPLVHLTFPEDARLHQVANGYTAAKLAFHTLFQECWPNSTYGITCGKVTHTGVKVGTELIISNLFPGRYEECTYEFGQKRIKRNVTVNTKTLYHTDNVQFTAHYNGIFLRPDPITHVLDDPNITVSVRNYDWESRTWGTYKTSGSDVVKYGVTGLKPSAQYTACVTVSQVGSTCAFGCKNKTWCHTLMTLPRMTPHQGSITGLWVVSGLLLLAVAALISEKILKCWGFDVEGHLTSKFGCGKCEQAGASNAQNSLIMQEMADVDLGNPY